MKKLLYVLSCLGSINLASAVSPAPSYGQMAYYGQWESTLRYPYHANHAMTTTPVVLFESAAYESGAVVQYVATGVPTVGKYPNSDTAWVAQQ
jgi:hypothetical protein